MAGGHEWAPPHQGQQSPPRVAVRTSPDLRLEPCPREDRGLAMVKSDQGGDIVVRVSDRSNTHSPVHRYT